MDRLNLRTVRETLLAVLLVISVFGWLDANGRLNRDEHQTCSIQARGLPASHIQATMWRDINVFIQPIEGEKPLPKTLHGKPFAAYYALVNLRQELPRYLTITAAQPHSRQC